LINPQFFFDMVQINIDQVIASRAPGVYKYLPRFIIRFFENFIRQSEMNVILKSAFEKKVKNMSMARHIVDNIGAKLSSEGSHNIPQTGGVIVASNHPLGSIDGLMLILEAGKVRSDIKFVVNDILMNVPYFDDLFIGVNKHGSTPKDILLEVDKVFASGHCVLLFPAGLCSRLQNGVIKDLEWQKTVISRAQKYRLPIIPTLIEARNSSVFYNLSLYRKKLGLKFNIEMLLLSREMFKQKDKHVHILFGKAIGPDRFDKTLNATAWAQKLKEFVYTLKQNPESIF
jgi:putative hemolysin